MFRVHVIDVGQGSATLLEFPEGAVLVDTGGEQNDLFDSNEALDQYLAAFFEGRPDLHGQLSALVLTHPHLDHTRGAMLVAEHYRPRNVVTNGQTRGSGAEPQVALQAWAEANQVGYEAVHLEGIPAQGLTDDVIDPVGGTPDPRITVLWGQVASDPGWGEAYDKPRFDNQNNHCVALRIEFGEAEVLITGDLEEAAIPDLLQRYQGTDLLDVDLYVVGHHGSRNGTTDELLAAMTPDCAVISMGPTGRQEDWTAWKYGHPSAETIERLELAVSGKRDPIEVPVGRGQRAFENRTVLDAIYATGWDGTVVLESGPGGVLRLAGPEP